MKKPDFSGVEPTRLAEARRRIGVIEGYLAIEGPNGEQTNAAAEKLGLTRWQFMRLTHAWRDHRDPAMLVKSRTGPSKRDYGIDTKAKQVALEVIRKLGMGAEISNAAPEIERICEAEGIEPPSRPTIYNYILAERRQGDLRVDGPPCLVVGRMWFHLPLTESAANSMPCLLAVAALPERIIVSYSISLRRDAPPSVVQALRDLFDQASSDGETRELLMSAVDRTAAMPILSSRNGLEIPRAKDSMQRMLAQAFGDGLGKLRPVYRRGSALVKPKYTMGAHDRPLTDVGAVAVIEQAIEANNSRRQELAPFSIHHQASTHPDGN